MNECGWWKRCRSHFCVRINWIIYFVEWPSCWLDFHSLSNPLASTFPPSAAFIIDFCGHLFPDYSKKKGNKTNNWPLVLNAAFLVSDSSWTASRWVSSWIPASVLLRFVTHPHMAVNEPKLWAFRTGGGWFQPISFHVCGRFLSERFRPSM